MISVPSDFGDYRRSRLVPKGLRELRDISQTSTAKSLPVG